MNIRNNGTIIGRVTRDPKVFTNRDGSRKVFMTIAVRDNFKSGSANEVQTQFVPVEAFVPKTVNGIGIYQRVHQGDQIGVHFSVRTSSYVDKDGHTQYKTTLQVQDVDLMEMRSVTEKRYAERVNGASQSRTAPAPDASDAAEDEYMPLEMTEDGIIEDDPF